MIAYHGDAALKRKTMAKVARHRKLDQLVRGTGAEGAGANFRGCAVGCTIGTYDHAAYETVLGVPQALARLEDRHFESLPMKEAMQWPTQFLGAIRTGADLTMVWPRYALWLLETELAKWATITEPVAALYRRWVDTGEKPPVSEWRAARAAAWRARAAYAYDAAYAADAADDAAYAADDAADAAAAYAYAAAAGAGAAAAYAYAYAYAAAAAYAYAYAAAAGARSAFWLRSSAKLLDLLKAAPVPRRTP